MRIATRADDRAAGLKNVVFEVADYGRLILKCYLVISGIDVVE